MMPLSAHLSGAPVSPASSASPSSSRHIPSHFRSEHSPRAENAKKNRTILNALLSTGILLQLYQIYKTMPIATEQPQVRRPLFDFTKDFSKAQKLDGGAKNSLHEIRRMVESKYPKYDPNFPQDNPYNTGYEYNRRKKSIYDNSFLHYGGDRSRTDDSLLDGNWTEKTEAPFQYPKYNYSQPAVETKFNLKQQPKPTNESIAVIILSGRSNFERRQAIRESWAKNHSNVYFIVGGPEPDNFEDTNTSNPNSTTARLFEEQSTYRDLLDTIHPDTYKALPYKLHYAIRWVAQHPKMRHVQWIVKADDDAVVRINTLKHWTLRRYNPAIPIVIGRVDPNARPHRTGKWAEDPFFFKWNEYEYPPWAYGSTGYVMTRSVADYVASEESLYYYQGEDTSLGIWLYESPLDVTWIDSPHFTLKNWRWDDHTYSAIIGHDLTPEAIRDCYEKYKDPKPLAEFKHANHTRQKGRIFRTDIHLLQEEEFGLLDFENDMWPDRLTENRDLQWNLMRSPDSAGEQISWQDSNDRVSKKSANSHDA